MSINRTAVRKTTITIVFAGGVGQRMNTRALPKQFLEVHGKPVLIYTLEQFQKHPFVDAIIVVCLKEWIEYCQNLIDRFQILKVMDVIPGGKSGQESIWHGIQRAKESFPEESVVLIHDGVRPLIGEETITKCIEMVRTKGNAITVSPAIETIFKRSSDTNQVGEIFRRSDCEMAKAPQCFILRDIYEAHCKANKENLADFIDSASLMQHYGMKLYTVEGSPENIKITTPSDFYIFRALLDAKENMQILGM